jgi:hypothetical protein
MTKNFVIDINDLEFLSDIEIKTAIS